MTEEKINKLHAFDWLSTLQEPAKRQQTIRPDHVHLHNELTETVRVYVQSDGDTVYTELLKLCDCTAPCYGSHSMLRYETSSTLLRSNHLDVTISIQQNLQKFQLPSQNNNPTLCGSRILLGEDVKSRRSSLCTVTPPTQAETNLSAPHSPTS